MQALTLSDHYGNALGDPLPPDQTSTTPIVVQPDNWATWYENTVPKPVRIFWMIARPISFAACVYHGYKRNESIGWAIGWGALAAFFPLITPTIAVAQGFGKPKKKSGFGRHRPKHKSRRRRTHRGHLRGSRHAARRLQAYYRS
jgi:hypothetical protein